MTADKRENAECVIEALLNTYEQHLAPIAYSNTWEGQLQWTFIEDLEFKKKNNYCKSNFFILNENLKTTIKKVFFQQSIHKMLRCVPWKRTVAPGNVIWFYEKGKNQSLKSCFSVWTVENTMYLLEVSKRTDNVRI